MRVYMKQEKKNREHNVHSKAVIGQLIDGLFIVCMEQKEQWIYEND
jgi:hypothetical protein